MYKHLQLKRSFFVFNNDGNVPEVEATDVTTTSYGKDSAVIKLLTKLLIMFVIFAGSAVLITIIVGLIFIYTNCSRPSRIRKQIPIEYLDPSEMISYSDDTPASSMSKHSDLENI